MKASLFKRIKSKKKRLKALKEEIIRFYSTVPETDLSEEKKEVLTYLKDNEISIFPYDFVKEYENEHRKVIKDDEEGLSYVVWQGKRIYGKAGWSVEKTQKYFNQIFLEQDVRSPHSYLGENFNVPENSVVADIGAAEGFFGVSIIEKISKLYLFEPQGKWHKPLMATFRPWKEKVEIIQKMVSDVNKGPFVTLDDYFDGKENIDFLKADVEGMEAHVLRGAKKMVLHRQPIRLSVTTYHNQDDAETLSSLLSEYGCNLSYSNGFMIYYYGKQNVVKPPYLRRGIIRAYK